MPVLPSVPSASEILLRFERCGATGSGCRSGLLTGAINQVAGSLEVNSPSMLVQSRAVLDEAVALVVELDQALDQIRTGGPTRWR